MAALRIQNNSAFLSMSNIITPTSTITIVIDNRTGQVQAKFSNDMPYPMVVLTLSALLQQFSNDFLLKSAVPIPDSSAQR